MRDQGIRRYTRDNGGKGIPVCSCEDLPIVQCPLPLL